MTSTAPLPIPAQLNTQLSSPACKKVRNCETYYKSRVRTAKESEKVRSSLPPSLSSAPSDADSSAAAAAAETYRKALSTNPGPDGFYSLLDRFLLDPENGLGLTAMRAHRVRVKFKRDHRAMIREMKMGEVEDFAATRVHDVE
uniref:Uncharacterized protein n=1 Tax=Corethron hystrix TaxID=216773 RepID=A0A7S1B5W8_9STRA|mmetsp:Transcript_13910/g.30559  ORF Transcript_13910/g.30559 Transcript_13910/m.30559 type:complete len:143 (+) Transcript_13910:125-553(+)|eukprot:CAMPEP_0113299304 /NCGR_PEP_ID=MMETSP0010_2-20120614/1393_1 /TAXON_ID=216773 ORGANISM="Corethron hystrix, Strain 308" /NCGR_SAMPLE_ID=MMETSP0010_2 /ASSEMBLY_ACC=CAM_ASM_000155 /LENGTH=142 /DNA_ID=CAMNT_0000152513 /DNA_START=119 /DNA_END=547 /DNA_ORIENTATION=+ /assembly_acc=CAM_ASM_000155